MKAYISGKISGLTWGQVCIKFLRAEIMLRDLGYEVVNPIRLNTPDVPWGECLQKDLQALAGCDIIVMLKDWKDSRGARIELDSAIFFKLEIKHILHINVKWLRLKDHIRKDQPAAPSQ